MYLKTNKKMIDSLGLSLPLILRLPQNLFPAYDSLLISHQNVSFQISLQCYLMAFKFHLCPPISISLLPLHKIPSSFLFVNDTKPPDHHTGDLAVSLELDFSGPPCPMKKPSSLNLSNHSPPPFAAMFFISHLDHCDFPNQNLIS